MEGSEPTNLSILPLLYLDILPVASSSIKALKGNDAIVSDIIETARQTAVMPKTLASVTVAPDADFGAKKLENICPTVVPLLFCVFAAVLVGNILLIIFVHIAMFAKLRRYGQRCINLWLVF
jgi:hypothetical protein